MNLTAEIPSPGVSYTTHTEWVYGVCQEAGAPLVIGVTVIVTLKIVFNFILALRRRKQKTEHANPESKTS